MDRLTEEIFIEIKEKYKDLDLTKFELEKILNSEFKVLSETIQNRILKDVKMIHLGTFKPTDWFKYNYDRFKHKRIDGARTKILE